MSLGPRHAVCGIDHQVAVGVIDPQVEGPAAVRVLQSCDGTPVVAANQAAEGGVQLGRPDPAGRVKSSGVAVTGTMTGEPD